MDSSIENAIKEGDRKLDEQSDEILRRTLEQLNKHNFQGCLNIVGADYLDNLSRARQENLTSDPIEEVKPSPQPAFPPPRAEKNKTKPDSTSRTVDTEQVPRWTKTIPITPTVSDYDLPSEGIIDYRIFYRDINHEDQPKSPQPVTEQMPLVVGEKDQTKEKKKSRRKKLAAGIGLLALTGAILAAALLSQGNNRRPVIRRPAPTTTVKPPPRTPSSNRKPSKPPSPPNVSLYPKSYSYPPWSFAAVKNPSDPFKALDEGIAKFNRAYGTHFSLQSHNGYLMYIQDGRIINPLQQARLDKIIKQL